MKILNDEMIDVLEILLEDKKMLVDNTEPQVDMLILQPNDDKFNNVISPAERLIRTNLIDIHEKY
jgi:hypothetical protein